MTDGTQASGLARERIMFSTAVFAEPGGNIRMLGTLQNLSCDGR